MKPGSEEAILHGCKCPEMDNYYGKGYCGNSNAVVVSLDCKVHRLLTVEEPTIVPQRMLSVG